MPYFKSSQEWLEQSTLLLEARPTTTRITTKYSIAPVKSRKARADSADGEATTTTTESSTKPPRGSLVIKTYDPVSGVTLKYRTTKAAEVSRLVYSSLGRLGRSMAAVPTDVTEEVMPDAPAKATEGGSDGDNGNAGGAGAATQQQSQPGGGKKKKKGRK